MQIGTLIRFMSTSFRLVIKCNSPEYSLEGAELEIVQMVILCKPFEVVNMWSRFICTEFCGCCSLIKRNCWSGCGVDGNIVGGELEMLNNSGMAMDIKAFFECREREEWLTVWDKCVLKFWIAETSSYVLTLL